MPAKITARVPFDDVDALEELVADEETDFDSRSGAIREAIRRLIEDETEDRIPESRIQ